MKSVQLILQNAKYEAIRFIQLKKVLKEIIGEINFEVHGEAALTKEHEDQKAIEFGDMSFIEELEDHYLDPSK